MRRYKSRSQRSGTPATVCLRVYTSIFARSVIQWDGRDLGGSTTKAASVAGNAMSQFETTYNSDWEKKVASLEKALRERDTKIALLMKSHNAKMGT